MKPNKPLGGDIYECEHDSAIAFWFGVVVTVLICGLIGTALVTGIIFLVRGSLS